MMKQMIQQKDNDSQINLTDNSDPELKEEQEQENEKKEFRLVLVDIEYSTISKIRCIERNMSDRDLRYIAVSYRWGELNEQLVKTPGYTARITSFNTRDLNLLCAKIYGDPDLKGIPYLWIDAISVDQQDHTRKKETILKMNQIYQNAAYILAVPDLHLGYLLKNTANIEIINLIKTHKETIYEEINMETKEKKGMNINQDIKKIYPFLAYLIDDWSNRAWVISEYHIAKEKYIRHETPLKYIFITLLYYESIWQPFFSYHFDDINNDDQQQQQQQYILNSESDDTNSKILIYEEVYDSKAFHQFAKERFMKRSHLEMILNTNATRNEDRFNAILPSWDNYKHIIKDKNTVSKWEISDMTSVRLKLYEIMDLWDKATLLHACSRYFNSILPSFASHYNKDRLKIVENYSNNNVAYRIFERSVLENIRRTESHISDGIDGNITHSNALCTENLVSIQFDSYRNCLSVESKSYFINNELHYNTDDWKNNLLLKEDDDIQRVFIPFFTIPACINDPLIYSSSSSIYLVGNMDKNKWILTKDYPGSYKSNHFQHDAYTFEIY